MRVHYIPSFHDYWSLNVFVLRKQFRAIIFIAAALLLVFAILPWLPNPSAPNRSVTEIYGASLGLLILPGIVVFTFAATYWGARKRWATADELRDEREYILDEDGVHMKSKSIDAVTEWKVFKEVVVTRKFVYLATAQRQFHYFPVTAVDDLPRLQALLLANVPNTKRV